MKHRRILSLFAALTLLFTLLPASGTAHAASLEGNGTEDDPYLITTANELILFEQTVNAGQYDACARLVENIVLTGAPWTYIGGPTAPYSGTFDGNGHTICNMYIFADSSYYAGLFSCIGPDGVVKNLGTIDSSSAAKAYVGSIAGINIGTIINCFNTITVNAGDYAGGIAGANGGVIANCWVDAIVGTEISGGGTFVGGITGANSGTVTNCYSIGKVSGSALYGALVGANDGGAVDGWYLYGSCAQSGGGVPLTDAQMKSDSFLYMLRAGTEGIDRACGWKKTDDYPAHSVTAPAVSSASYVSLSLRGDIGINFYVDAAAYLDDLSRASVKLTYNHSKTRTPDVYADEYPLAGMTPEANGTFKFTASMLPVQITDKVKAELYYDGQLITVISGGYSIYDYCTYMSAMPASSVPAKLRALCSSIVNYGGYTREQFSYASDTAIVKDPTFGGMTEDELALLCSELYAPKLEGSADGLTVDSVSFFALENSSLRFYVSTGYDIGDYDIGFTAPAGSAMEVRTGNADGRTYIEISGIESGHLTDILVLKITKAGTGNTLTVTASPMTYPRSALLYSGSGPALIGFSKALYQYAKAASAYFD